MTLGNKRVARAFPISFFNMVVIAGLCVSVLLSQAIFSFVLYGDKTLSLSDNYTRIQAIQKMTRVPGSIQQMDARTIDMVMREPSLKRSEHHITAWHYHGESCALDIYFTQGQDRPDYIEYRALTLNEEVQAQFDDTDNQSMQNYCLQDVMAAQGINTPNNFARRPLPSWDNPYRS